MAGPVLDLRTVRFKEQRAAGIGARDGLSIDFAHGPSSFLRITAADLAFLLIPLAHLSTGGLPIIVKLIT